MSKAPSKCRDAIHLVFENPGDGQYVSLVYETPKANFVFSGIPNIIWEDRNIIMDPDLCIKQEAEAYLRLMVGGIPVGLF